MNFLGFILEQSTNRTSTDTHRLHTRLSERQSLQIFPHTHFHPIGVINLYHPSQIMQEANAYEQAQMCPKPICHAKIFNYVCVVETVFLTLAVWHS